MIRPTTVAWLALALLIVVGLFHVKFQVQALEDELVRLNRQIDGEQEAIHVLKAEWSYVNQPQRLQDLSSRYLELRPLTPRQIVNLADFGRDTLDTLPPPPPPTRSIAGAAPRQREANAITLVPPRATLAAHTQAPTAPKADSGIITLIPPRAVLAAQTQAPIVPKAEPNVITLIPPRSMQAARTPPSVAAAPKPEDER